MVAACRDASQDAPADKEHMHGNLLCPGRVLLRHMHTAAYMYIQHEKGSCARM